MDPLDFLAKIHADQISLAGVVFLGIVSIIRGWIVPRQVVVDRIADKDAQIAQVSVERDNYRQAWEKAREANFESIAQIGKLVTAGDATVRLVETMRNEVERNGLAVRTEAERDGLVRRSEVERDGQAARDQRAAADGVTS